MSFLVVCVVAAVASGLTFFSGFGLGTLLLPAFSLFVPVDQAIALTAVVHFLNSLYKVLLVGRLTDWGVLIRFGLPAIVAAGGGAWVLGQLATGPPLLEYTAFGGHFSVTPVNLAIGLLLSIFAVLELWPVTSNLAFSPRWLSVGGVASGFFGGLSGMQGALRSAFLIRAGLSKEAFVATGAAIACLVDLSRLGVYLSVEKALHGLFPRMRTPKKPRFFGVRCRRIQRRVTLSTGCYASRLSAVADSLDIPLLSCAVVAAFTGATLGRMVLPKVKIVFVQRLVATMMLLVATCLIAGLR